eukprot:scaffold16167_cov28-Tisochrysis_lutea.AAC.4
MYRGNISRWLMRTGSVRPRQPGGLSANNRRHRRQSTSRKRTSAGGHRALFTPTRPDVISRHSSWQHAVLTSSCPPWGGVAMRARCRARLPFGEEVCAGSWFTSRSSCATAFAFAASSVSTFSASSSSPSNCRHNCKRSRGACHRASSRRRAKARTGSPGCGAPDSRRVASGTVSC